jgi:hypothetical protein
MIPMEYSAAVQSKPKPQPEEAPSAGLQSDLRWELAQRVVAGPHFARSPLLSKFLLFVVAETLEGRGDEITEHQIGVQVFDRPADYRTLEDNIVRSYARQLRKRLAEHFAGEGRSEPVRIDIPLGGYVPVFLPGADEDAKEDAAEVPVPQLGRTQASGSHTDSAQSTATQATPWRAKTNRIVLGLLLLAVYSATLIAATWYGATWYAGAHVPSVQQAESPAHVLWAALFSGPANCFIVPSDAGFNLLEDLSRRPVPLAQYIAGSYQAMPLGGVDVHSAEDLRSQQLTPFVDLQISSAFAHLTEDNPQRVFIRFPRDLRLDDLKNANAVIIGSVGSNPWAALAESNANFRIVDHPGMRGATIENLKPRAGEATSYESRWNEPAHETFALITFFPNLSGNGHLLVLEGLDVAGTQAAAEMLLHPSAIDTILSGATRPDGSLHNFEVLLRSTSIESSATGTQVIASRIY